MKVKTSRRKYVFAYLIFLSSFILFSFYTNLFIILFLITSLLLIIDIECEILFKKYEINEKEVKMIKGILGKKIVSISKENITHVELKQDILDRLLNIGDIIVHSQTLKIELKGIRNPYEILRIIKG